MNALSKMPRRGWGLLGEFDHLVNDLLAPDRFGEFADRQIMPAMDIVENENSYVVSTDLPGVQKENLKINVKDNVLIIEAESSRENVKKDGEKVIKLERCSGRYRRTLKLGNVVDETAISADYADGVLTLTLPKSEKEASRQIEVAVH